MKRKETPSDKTLQPSPEAGNRGQALGSDNQEVILLVTGILLAILFRYPLIPFDSNDYYSGASSWWDFLLQNDNFAALKYSFSDYNVPTLYLIAILSALFPESSKIFAIKGLYIIFDFVLAFFVYKTVRFKYHRGREATLAALATLFAPTVVLNSAMWGQTDATYTAFLVACLYFLLTRRQALAFLAFGLAFSFKLQAVFLTPLFLWLLVKKEVNSRYLLFAPLCWFILLLPAWLVGRPLKELFSIYYEQTLHYPASLTVHAPNLYQWISRAHYDWVYPMSVYSAGGVILAIAVFVYRSRATITADRLIFLAFLSVLVMPYLLPKMHDRYFFPADVIAILFAFYWPRYWYAPIVVGLASLLTYERFLRGGDPLIHFSWPAAALLALIGILGWHFLQIFGRARNSRGEA